MYDSRGFALPGSATGASAYLAQHDFVHVLADYGTNLKGELEVFAFIGRADPDPKGFAWLATLDRAVRDRLHRGYRLLRARRPGTHHPGTWHAPPNRGCHFARQARQ